MGETDHNRPRTTGLVEAQSQQHQGSRQVCVSWTKKMLDNDWTGPNRVQGFQQSCRRQSFRGKMGPLKNQEPRGWSQKSPRFDEQAAGHMAEKDRSNHQREAHGQWGRGYLHHPSVQSSGQFVVPSDVVPSNVAAGAMVLAWAASLLGINTNPSIHPSIRVRGNRQAGRQAGKPNPKSPQETRPSPVPSTGRSRAKGFFKYTKSH